MEAAEYTEAPKESRTQNYDTWRTSYTSFFLSRASLRINYSRVHLSD